MKAYKATFFANCWHKIEEIECVKLTLDAVVIPRSAKEMERLNTNKPIIFQREANGTRYCASKNEAMDFLDCKYQDKIESLQGLIYSYKQKQKSLLGEI